MMEALASMAQVLMCPVEFASELGEYCEDLAVESETRGNVGRFARELYARPGELEAEVSAVLEDFAATMERHARELAVLAGRFERLEDHDISHAHIELDESSLAGLAEAMFGPPASDEELQEG